MNLPENLCDLHGVIHRPAFPNSDGATRCERVADAYYYVSTELKRTKTPTITCLLCSAEQGPRR